jgi:hypothetical protein
MPSEPVTDKEKINALFERISDLSRELTAYQEWAEDVKRLTREIRVAHECWEASIREGK